MTLNVGSVDRVFRAILGVVLIALPLLTNFAIWQNSALFYGALLVGAVVLGTAIFRVCPAYSLFGIKTTRG